MTASLASERMAVQRTSVHRSAMPSLNAPVAAPIGPAPAPARAPTFGAVQPSPLWCAVIDPPSQHERWRTALAPLLPNWRLAWPDEREALSKSQVLLTWNPRSELIATMPRLQLVQLLDARCDALDGLKLPYGTQVARTFAANQTRQLVEYVSAGVLHYHRGFDIYAAQQSQQVWKPLPSRTADERRVGVMGLGELGAAAATQLAQLGFRVRGWSRHARQLPGVEVYCGERELEAFARAVEILVCVLPRHASNRALIDRTLLHTLPPGARLIHLGHAEQLQRDDLLAALDEGQLAHAMVDCFETDALPREQALWRHPRVVVTPHVASVLRPEVGAAQVARNLQRLMRREALQHLVGAVADE